MTTLEIQLLNLTHEITLCYCRKLYQGGGGRLGRLSRKNFLAGYLMPWFRFCLEEETGTRVVSGERELSNVRW